MKIPISCHKKQNQTAPQLQARYTISAPRDLDYDPENNPIPNENPTENIRSNRWAILALLARWSLGKNGNKKAGDQRASIGPYSASCSSLQRGRTQRRERMRKAQASARWLRLRAKKARWGPDLHAAEALDLELPRSLDLWSTGNRRSRFSLRRTQDRSPPPLSLPVQCPRLHSRGR